MISNQKEILGRRSMMKQNNDMMKTRKKKSFQSFSFFFLVFQARAVFNSLASIFIYIEKSMSEKANL